MNGVIKVILSLSLSGSMLILILLLCKPVFREKISKTWQFYIWLIVIARLLLPFAPQTNMVGSFFKTMDHSVLQSDISLQSQQSDSVFGSVKLNYSKKAADDYSMIKNADRQGYVGASLLKIFDRMSKYIGIIWMTVALMLLIRKITIYQSFVKYIAAGRVEIAEIKLLEQLGKTAERVGVKAPVELYANSSISSPLLIGFFRPSIVLPSTELSDSDFQFTILHELIHFKRCDMFYKWLVQLVTCLHWFNPLVFLMGREINRACEFSCDEAVIGKLDYEGKRAYGDTLLNAMCARGSRKNIFASVPLNDGKELMKERLDAIMKYKKKSKAIIGATAMITLFLLCGATYAGAYAATGGSLSKQNSPLEHPETAILSKEKDKLIKQDKEDTDDEMKTATVMSEVYYLVDTEAQLRSIGGSKYSLDMNYMLNSDITLTEEWTAIGDFDHPFTGTFTGNGFEIKDLKNTDPNAEFIGLFGYADGAHIYNVTLRNVDISKAGGKGKHAGAIVAIAKNSKIYDNYVMN